MTKSTSTTTEELAANKYAWLAPIIASEVEIAKLKAEGRETNKACSVMKMENYAALASAVAKQIEAGAKYGQREKEELTKVMIASGVTPACAKRYRENTFGALSKIRDMKAAALEGEEQVLEFLKTHKIETESKLKTTAFGGSDPVNGVVRAYMRLDEDDRARFETEKKAALKAEKEAEKAAEQEDDNIQEAA